MSVQHFDDPDVARRYADGPAKFVPGYQVMQRMVAQLLAERAGDDAEILVLGAGGGLELETFATLQPGWRFTALDPSAEMLKQAELVVSRVGATDRVRWVRGYIPEAPEGPFDAASCLLTLHFIADDGRKLEALRAIRDRLKPGGRFALVDLCMDKGAPGFELRLDRYAQFAVGSGASPQDVAETRGRLATVLNMVDSGREETLLREAKFDDIELFYAGLSWRGWIANV